MLFIIYLILLTICFVIGFVALFLNKRSPLHIKLFPWFIFITWVVEVNVKYWLAKYTTQFYTFFTVLDFIFFSFLLHQIVQNKKVKRVIVYATYGFLPAILINIFFVAGINRFHTLTFIIGCALLAFFSAYYLYELILKNPAVKPFTEASFWIVSGILLWHSCAAPILLTMEFLHQFSNVDLNSLNIFFTCINYLYYTLFNIAFLCLLKFRKNQ